MNKIFGVLYIFLALTICSYTYSANESEKPYPKITLSSQATIFKPADELQLSIGVVEVGEKAEAVLQANSAKMEAVIANLESIGLTKKEYQTGRFSITPTYTPYPKNPPPNWKPSINGYEVNNTLTIKTDKIPLAGKLIDAANKAGANSIENIHFALHDPRAYWNEAMAAATTNAINDVKVIAQAAGVKLGRIISITLDNANAISPRINNIYFAKSSGAETAPPIEAGDVSITANVSIIYELME